MIVSFIAWAVIIFGTILIFSSGMAVLRFPDPYMKIHASSKANYGAGSILLGMILLEGLTETTGLIFLASVFLFVTSPILGHSLGRSAYVEKEYLKDIESIDYSDFKNGKDGEKRC